MTNDTTPQGAATPSAAEIAAMAESFDCEGWSCPEAAKRAYTRAVLARWGAPQAAQPLQQSEPVAWVDASTRLPEWTDDFSVRVLAVTADDDFGGVQMHDIPAADFYAGDYDETDERGTEVTRACTHWLYRNDVWPSMRPAQCLQQSAPVPMTDEQIAASFTSIGLEKYLDTFTLGVKLAERHNKITSKAEGAQP